MLPLDTGNKKILEIRKFDFEEDFFIYPQIVKVLRVNCSLYRIVTILIAILLLITLSPLFVLISLAIYISMSGPIFYSQLRVGRNGKEFSIYKFRTMVVDAERSTGAILAERDDIRITPLGKFLRRTHFDELPQLYNVILGDMDFIGPRPERPCFVSEFDKIIPLYSKRKEVNPGIIGLAQVCLPYSASAKEKIKYDSYYIDNQSSIALNLMICYYTVLKILGVLAIEQPQE